MFKPLKTIPNQEDDLQEALSQLNYFFADKSAWVPTWSKKDQIDLFYVSVPANTTYYKRCLGLSPKPLLILSGQSLGRLYHCLFTANPLLEVLAQILSEEERLLIEESPRPTQEVGDKQDDKKRGTKDAHPTSTTTVK